MYKPYLLQSLYSENCQRPKLWFFVRKKIQLSFFKPYKKTGYLTTYKFSEKKTNNILRCEFNQMNERILANKIKRYSCQKNVARIKLKISVLVSFLSRIEKKRTFLCMESSKN